MKRFIFAAVVVFALTASANAAWNQQCFFGRCCINGVINQECNRLEKMCHKKCIAVKGQRGGAFIKCKKSCIDNRGNTAVSRTTVIKPAPAPAPAPAVTARPAPAVVRQAPAAAVVPAAKTEPKMEVGKTVKISGSNFASNSAKVSPEFEKYLHGKSKELKGLNYTKVTIVGYSDSIGDPAYNVYLSEQRAKAVADVFIKDGVPADKIQYTGKGAADPVASNQTKEGRAENRRVEISVK